MSPPSLRAVSFKGVLTEQPFWLTHAVRKKKKKNRRSVSVCVHSCGSFYDEPQRDSKRKKGRKEGMKEEEE